MSLHLNDFLRSGVNVPSLIKAQLISLWGSRSHNDHFLQRLTSFLTCGLLFWGSDRYRDRYFQRSCCPASVASLCWSVGLIMGYCIYILLLFSGNDSCFLLWIAFPCAACWFNCVRVGAQSAPDDTFVSGSVSGHWMLFRNTKAAQKAVFTSTATLNGRNNVARRCGVSQQSHGTTSLNPKLICPHRLQQGGRKEQPIVFCFCLQLHK